jgi:hypothetical protein
LNGPAAAAGDDTTWTDAKRLFNFRTLEVARDGTPVASVVDTAGKTRFSLELQPS